LSDVSTINDDRKIMNRTIAAASEIKSGWTLYSLIKYRGTCPNTYFPFSPDKDYTTSIS